MKKYEINLPDYWKHSKGVDYILLVDGEDLWQASYDVWTMDVGRHDGKFIFQVVKNCDWTSPVQYQEFKDIDELIEEIEKTGNYIQYLPNIG